MPISVNGFTALTQVARLVVESTTGEQSLLPQTAGAATVSLNIQPNGAFTTTTGCHLHFYITGNSGSGTITIAGTAPVTGSAVNSQTYHINPAPLNTQGYSEFTTTEVFATVNASGITMSAGMLPCQVMIYGSPAAKFLVPCEVDAEEHIGRFSPPDRRGILSKDYRIQQTHKWATLDKFDSSVYPDQLWMLYMLVTKNPTVTTVPAAPTSLLASTAIAATMTLTSSPVAPGEFLIFSITGNTASGTIVVGGTDIFGNVYSSSETINFTSAATQTVYSTRRYSVVNTGGSNKFTTTGGTGSSIAVTGVYAWTYTGTWDGINNTAKATATFELFDGVQGVKLPFTYLSEGTFSWEKEKEITFAGKGEAQDFLIVGDPNPTTYPSGTNPFAVLTQPTAMPMAGWPATFTIDSLPTGTPLTTQDGSLINLKIAISTGLKGFYVGDGMQRWSNMTYGGEPDVALDATIIYQSYAIANNYFKPNLKFALGVTFQGSLLGNIASTTYYENIQFVFPVKVDVLKSDRGKDPVEATLKIMNEYDFGLSYAFKMSMTSQVPPTYLS